MSDPDWFAWVAFAGSVAMIVAASFVDWRAGLFIAGLVVWMDFR